MKKPQWFRVIIAIVLFALAGTMTTACSDSVARTGPVPEVVQPNQVFNAVVIGDVASTSFVGSSTVSTSWAQRWFRNALPRSVTFFNLSSQYMTTDEAVSRSLPELSSLHPQVVAIFLGTGDIEEKVPAAQYAAALAIVVDTVKASGAKTILLGNLPDEIAEAAQYNAAAKRAIDTRGITLVDLVPLTLAFDATARNHQYVPDAASMKLIENAFTQAYATVSSAK